MIMQPAVCIILFRGTDMASPLDDDVILEDRFAGYAAAERWAKLGKGREKCLASWERREYIERETGEGGIEGTARECRVVTVLVLVELWKSSASQYFVDGMAKYSGPHSDRRRTPIAISGLQFYSYQTTQADSSSTTAPTFSSFLPLIRLYPSSTVELIVRWYHPISEL